VQERLLTELGTLYEENPTHFSSVATSYQDGDGFIGKSEFRKLCRSLHLQAEKDEVDSFFELLDTEMECKILCKRMEASLRWVGKQRRTTLVRGKEMVFRSERQLHERVGEAMRANELRVLDLFREWDQDEDGVISRAEFRSALPLLGLMLSTREDADKLFDFFDANHDGEISFEEFHQILRRDGKGKAQEGEVIPEDEKLRDLDKVRAEVYDMVNAL